MRAALILHGRRRRQVNASPGMPRSITDASLVAIASRTNAAAISSSAGSIMRGMLPAERFPVLLIQVEPVLLGHRDLAALIAAMIGAK